MSADSSKPCHLRLLGAQKEPPMPDDMNDRPANGHAPALTPPEKPRLVVTFAAPGAIHFAIEVEGDVHPAQMALVGKWLDEQASLWMRTTLAKQLAPRVERPGLLVP